MSVTELRNYDIQKITFAWTSNGAGAVTETSTYKYTGEILRCVVVPGTDGDQPSDQFDVAINDDAGIDVLAGMGANLSNASPTTIAQPVGAVVNSTLACVVTNAGDTNKGAVIVYVR